MYTRSSVQDSSNSLPRDWRRITVNLLHGESRAELFISPEGRRFADLKSAKAWIAKSIESSTNSDIIESPRKFRWRKAEERSEEESKYSPENVKRRKARWQGRKTNRNLLQTALKKKFKIRVTKSRGTKPTNKPAVSKMSKTKDRIKKATVTRIKATFGFNRRL